MSPGEYVAQLEKLVREGRDAEALELAARYSSDVAPRLDAETFFRMSALLEGAELAISTATARPEPAEGSTPSAEQPALPSL